jgi:ATP-binding cassette, subfamily C (CFTR/MRP), member 1
MTDGCSGKSSLVGSILRILPSISGEVVIDSISLIDISVRTLRRRIISVPQDFVYLPGSIRFNMDPFEQCSDTEIENALVKVNLWGKITSDGNLDSEFNSGEFSTGEKQLLSLARAVLQRKAQGTALVLMDEATSHMDEQTEYLMHQLLVDELNGCTIINVAHRPASLQRADLIVSMDSGRIVEVAKPKNLQHKVIVE